MWPRQIRQGCVQHLTTDRRRRERVRYA